MKYLFSILFLVSSIIAQNHILITEIVVTPTAGEFVEIYNNTSTTIDLSDYYLTDATHAGSGNYYYNIVTGSNAGGGGYSDFHARFPAGATIAPGEFQTIAVDGAGFVTTYGSQPNYEINGTDGGIPDMREALSGSINGQGGITNSGEVMVLYYWDGQSDLVQDVDYVVWGDKNEAIDKTGISIDGPDADTTPSSYLNDTAIGSQISVSSGDPHTIGKSSQRLDITEHSETQSGGNGITGNDETSEDLATSFQTDDPNPGTGPASSNVPVISNIIQIPVSPSPLDTIFISADVTDDGSVVSVKLFTSINSASFDSTDMTFQSGDTYESFILPQADGTQVSYYIKAEDNDGQSSSSSILNFTVLSGSAPNISNIIQNPTNPAHTDTVTISADITDDGSITVAKLFTSVNSSPFDSVDMNLQSGDTYIADVLPQSAGSQVDYYIKATDDEGLATTSSTLNYTVSSAGIIIPIADIQNTPGLIGQQVTIEGIVTLGAGVTTTKWTSAYVQDSSGRGINIYKSGTIDTDLVRKNQVRITGTVDEFDGVTELIDYSVQIINTNQPLPAVTELSTYNANNLDYEGTYILTKGVIADKYSAGGGTNIEIDDGSGSLAIRAWDTANLNLSSYLIGDTVLIKGVLGIYINDTSTPPDTVPQILLAYQDEIEYTTLDILGDGSGVVTVSPDTVAANDSLEIIFTFTGNSLDTVTTVELEIPNDWTWNGNFSLSGSLSGATTSVNGNIINISNTQLKKDDQGQIELFGMKAPNQGKYSIFGFKTATQNGTLTSVVQPPMIIVVGAAGTGIVTVSPDSVGVSELTDLSFVFEGNSISKISRVELTIPSEWNWSGLPADVNWTGPVPDTSQISVNGDIISVTSISLENNIEGMVTINGMTSPSADTVSQFNVRTGDPAKLSTIADQPVVMTGDGTQITTISLKQIQTDSTWIGKNVTIKGVVTIGSGILRTDMTDTYVQDTSGYGINVFSFDTPDPNIIRGHLFLISGLVEEYSGTTEITNYSLTLLRKNSPIPSIREISTSNAAKALHLEGSFIKVSGTIVDKYSAGGGTNIFVDDGSGEVTIRIWDTAQLELGDFQIGDGIIAMGVMGEWDNAGQILVGYQQDIYHIVLPKVPLFLEAPNRPFLPDRGEKLYLKYSAGSEDTHTTMRIYDLAGRLVKTLLDEKGRSFEQVISWDGRDRINDLAPLGAYILHYEVVNESTGESWEKVAPIVVGTVLK